MNRDQVFISYSHADGDWLKRLQIMLAPLRRQGMLDVWEDTRIEPPRISWRLVGVSHAAIADSVSC